MRESAYAALKAAYQQYLGRDVESDAALESHLNGDYSQASIDRAIGFILRSPEAVAFKNQPAPTTTTTPPPGTSTATQPGTVTQNVGNPTQPFEGFDFSRPQDTGRSAKDAYASLVRAAPPAPGNDKTALAAWFRQYIEPGMNALGHHVLSVTGDSFTFENWQGRWTVDHARGAGAEGWAHAWQPQENGGAGAFAYKPYAPMTTAPPTVPGPTTPGPGLTPPAPPTTTGPDGTPAAASMPMAQLAIPGAEPVVSATGMPMAQLAQTYGGPQPSPLIPQPGDVFMSDLARQRAQRIGRFA